MKLRFIAAVAALSVAGLPAQGAECGSRVDGRDAFLACTSLGDVGIAAAPSGQTFSGRMIEIAGSTPTRIRAPKSLWVLINGRASANVGNPPSFVALHIVAVHGERQTVHDRNLTLYRNRGWVRLHPFTGRHLRFTTRRDSLEQFRGIDLDHFADLHLGEDAAAAEAVTDFLGGFQFHGRPSREAKSSWDVHGFFARRATSIADCDDIAVCDLRVKLLKFTVGQSSVDSWIGTEGLRRIHLFTTSTDELFDHHHVIDLE